MLASILIISFLVILFLTSIALLLIGVIKKDKTAFIASAIVFLVFGLIIAGIVLFLTLARFETRMSGLVPTVGGTYQETTYGFAFAYPANTTVKTIWPSPRFGTGKSYDVVGTLGGGAFTKSSYDVNVKENTSNQTLQQVFDENYNRLKKDATPGGEYQLKDLYTSDIKVSGVDAKAVFVDHFGDSGSTMVSIVHNGFVYLIAGGDKKGDLDQFLSTFTFTK